MSNRVATDTRGFSLVEMLVTMGIFAVITTSVVANFRAGRQSDELRIGSQLLAAQVRKAQSMAVSGRTIAWCVGGSNAGRLCPTGAAGCPSGSCNTDTPKGYGVRLDVATAGAANTKMILFADIDGDRSLDVGETISTDSLVSTGQVSSSAITPNSGGKLDVVFAPPKPTVWLNGVNSGAVATVTLTHKTSAKVRTVQLNSLTGQVTSN